MRPTPPEILGAPAAKAGRARAIRQALERYRAGDPVGVSLATPLPRRLAPGRGSAIFLEGCCHPREAVRKLEVLVGERPHRVRMRGMPLPGTIAAGCYWWSVVPLHEADCEQGEARMRLRATLRDGSTFTTSLRRSELETESERDDRLDAHPASAGRDFVSATGAARSNGSQRDAATPLVAISMATYNPPISLFKRQVDSIRAQTHERWVCVISDDRSEPERLAAMLEVVADDPRFVVSPSPARLGFYGNFERALTMAPRASEYVTFADQDDWWSPEKLEALIDAMRPGTQLVYSDMRIVLEDGELISETFWNHRRNNYRNLGSLLMANTVTGAASLFRAEVLDYALPFPPRHAEMYHDHWIALVALALGDIGYIDRPLYDYVQHGRAVLGHANANASAARTSSRVARARDRAHLLRRRRHHLGWRGLYFRVLARMLVLAQALELRCGERMARRKRRALARLLSADRRLPVGALLWLLGRRARAALGARETVGMERILVRALIWQRFTAMRGLRQRSQPCGQHAAAEAVSPYSPARPGAGP